ncbi:MAG: hypothetical protein ACFFA3_19130 [Promethearchaeota archaeon]
MFKDILNKMKAESKGVQPKKQKKSSKKPKVKKTPSKKPKIKPEPQKPVISQPQIKLQPQKLVISQPKKVKKEKLKKIEEKEELQIEKAEIQISKEEGKKDIQSRETKPVIKEEVKEPLKIKIKTKEEEKMQIEEDIKKKTVEQVGIPLMEFEGDASAPILRYDLPSPSSYEGRFYLEIKLDEDFFDPNKTSQALEHESLLKKFLTKNKADILEYLEKITIEELERDVYEVLKQQDVLKLGEKEKEKIKEIVKKILIEKGTIAGIAIAGSNDWCYYWYNDGTVSAGSSSNGGKYKAPYRYSLYGSRKYQDIVGIGIAGSNDWCYYWYKDGKVSAGMSSNSVKYKSPYSYKLPPGKNYEDIVGIGIAGSNDRCYYWYKDGTVSSGTSSDAGKYKAPYDYILPPGKKYEDIVGIGIAGSNDWCYYWYKDGTVSAGTSSNAGQYKAPYKYVLPQGKKPVITDEIEVVEEVQQEEEVPVPLSLEEKYELFEYYIRIALIEENVFPSFYRTMGGRLKLTFGKVKDLTPTLMFIETYKLTAFPGDYGAGSTIQTFSLLPKEVSEISVKTWKRTQDKIDEASSIFDSYTEDKADEFENSIQNESSRSSKVENSTSYHVDVGVNASWGWGSAGVNAGTAGSSKSAREEFSKNVMNAASKHAQSASSKREVSVNTSFERSVETEEETVIMRRIENLNASRTLNFTFRQMNQEYHSILHLTDVRLAYYNGFPGSMKEYALYELENLIKKQMIDPDDYLKTEPEPEEYLIAAGTKSPQTYEQAKNKYNQVHNELKQIILNEYGNVYDYQGTMTPLIEEINMLDGKINYLRIIPSMTIYNENTGEYEIKGRQAYTIRESNKETNQPKDVRWVDGVIISTNKVTMKTDGVIVESLLGQGNALDNFSLEAREEKLKKEFFENELRKAEIEKVKTGIKIIEALINSGQLAKAIDSYKEIFGIQTGLKTFGEIFDHPSLKIEKKL